MAESILKLKVASEEYENKLKRASEGLQKYIEGCRKAGGTLEHLDDGVLDFVKALGSMETKSTSARGKISELRKGFIDMKAEYLHMTEAEKNGDIGKALSASLDQMKNRFHVAKNELAEINKELSGNNFGEFGNVLDTLGSKLGVTGNLTEMLTSKTALLTGAVGAGIAVVTKSAEAWASYNAELAKQDQITTVTTGLKGEDADRMTDKMRALSDTYKVDFREAVNAANTLMTQFGATGDEATQLIKDGMRGMIQGDGPKLLSMIQQYAPAFRDAGVSASQLVAVIQNSEGGIFTDQNMNAIVMGIKNIRLMTKATSDALAQLGIDGEKMSKQLSDGSLTIFDALKQVANQIQTVDSNSKEAGEVMQQVFGRQGAMAGTKLGEAIATLNTNLEETKKQTGEVGEAFAELQTANEKLNTSIREAFSYDGWDQMAQGIRAKLVTALAEVVGMLASIRKYINGDTTTWNIKTKPGVKNVADDPNVDDKGNYINKPWKKTPAPIKFYGDEETTPKPKPRRTGGGNKNTIKEEKDEFTEIIGLIGNAQERVADLQKQMRETWDGNNIASLRKELKAAQDKLDVLQGKLPKDSKVELTITADDTDALQKVKDIEGVTLDEKTMTVTANTSEALQKVQELVADIDGKVVNVKVVPVITDDDIDKQLQRQYGKAIQVPITPKLTAGEELVQSIRIKLAEDNINADMQTLRTLLETQIKNGIEGVEIPSDLLIQQIVGEGINIPDEYWENLQKQINEKLKEMGIESIDVDFKTGNNKKNKNKKDDKEDKKYLSEGLSQLSGSLNGLQSGFAQLGIDLGDGFGSVVGALSGISTILIAIQTIVSAIEAISAVDAIIPFANGGIVPTFANGGLIGKAAGGMLIPGNSFSGDNLRLPVDGGRGFIGVNSGELILSRAQQGNLASQLSGGGVNGNLRLETYVSGRDLRIVLNNESQGRLKGKYVTSNNVR